VGIGSAEAWYVNSEVGCNNTDEARTQGADYIIVVPENVDDRAQYFLRHPMPGLLSTFLFGLFDGFIQGFGCDWGRSRAAGHNEFAFLLFLWEGLDVSVKGPLKGRANRPSVLSEDMVKTK
jgi:hypothetical protein